MSVPLLAPLVEFVRLWRQFDIVGELLSSRKTRAVPTIQRESLSTPRDLGLPFADHKEAHGSIRIHAKTVDSIAQQVDGRVRRIHLKHLIGCEVMHADRQVAAG